MRKLRTTYGEHRTILDNVKNHNYCFGPRCDKQQREGNVGAGRVLQWAGHPALGLLGHSVQAPRHLQFPGREAQGPQDRCALMHDAV